MTEGAAFRSLYLWEQYTCISASSKSAMSRRVPSMFHLRQITGSGKTTDPRGMPVPHPALYFECGMSEPPKTSCMLFATSGRSA
jgi:hypothetical protein